MALAPLTAICDTDHHRFAAVPTRSFLGFQRVDCPLCHARLVYPLSRGYRVGYWILGILVVLGSCGEIMSGGLGVARGLGQALWLIPAVIALLGNASIASSRPRAGDRPAEPPA